MQMEEGVLLWQTQGNQEKLLEEGQLRLNFKKSQVWEEQEHSRWIKLRCTKP